MTKDEIITKWKRSNKLLLITTRSYAASHFHCSIKEELKCLAAKMKVSYGAEKTINKDVNKDIKLLFK